MNSDDLRIAHIIKQGPLGDIVIVGSPFDFVRKRSINKGGEENGPCCLRRFFARVGPIQNCEYDIDITSVNLSDYGNIEFKEDTPEKCILKIASQIKNILENKRLPFTFGGSKESLLGSFKAFNQVYPQGQHILICGKPHLKRPYDHDKLTSDNSLTILINQFPEKQILFGPHSRYFPQQYNHKFKYISHEDIRKTTKNKNHSNSLRTQAAIAMKEILDSKQKLPLHVSLTVQAIQRFSGCRDILSYGITVEQIIQIFFLLGQTPNVKCIDISEFNPSCEDYESSVLLVNLLYYFSMGWTKRVK